MAASNPNSSGSSASSVAMDQPGESADLIGCGSRRMSSGSDKASKKSESLTSSIRRKISGGSFRRKKRTSTTSSCSQSSVEKDEVGSPPIMNSFESLDGKEEATYRAILRSIVSPLGSWSSKTGQFPHHLTERLQMMYEVDLASHEGWLREEGKSKRANNTAILYVRVIEAKDLPTSNGHGPADPYCLLSVVRPHKSNRGTPTSSPRLKHKKTSSFDMNDVKKTTTMKKTTEPKWNEEFEIDVEDLTSEVLEVYVTMNDQDPNLLQLKKHMDGASRLQCMFRHVKHALEHGKSLDNDVLGYVKISLKDILAVGSTTWYDLTSKMCSKGKKNGKIHLQLQLKYNKECAESEQDCHQTVLTQYHSAMTRFHRIAGKRAYANFNDYGGKLSQEVDLILDYFAVPHDISKVSKHLLNVVCLLEMAVSHQEVTVKTDAITEAISNFETVWCSYQMDMPRGDDAAGSRISDMEVEMFEKATNNYVSHLASSTGDLPHLFPPHEVFVEQYARKFGAVVRLFKIELASDWSPSSKRDLIHLITERIQSDVKQWLCQQLETVSSNVRDSVIPETRQLLSVINEVREACTPKCGYTQFFGKLDIDFFKIVSITLDGKLCARAQELLISLDQYQNRYHKCHVNIQQSCKLSLQLYVALRQLYVQMKENVTERQVFKLTLSKFYMWFNDAMIFWLQMFRQESIRRMEKALEIDKDVVQVTSLVKYSNSSVDVLSCFSTIISEWKQIEYASPDTNLMGITKITDTICDGTRIYTNKIRKILENNRYYDNEQQQFDVTTQLCITLNNIEHVRQFLDELPELLRWDEVAEEISIAHEEEEVGKRALITLSELVADANNDIKMQSCFLLQRVTDRMSVDISNLTELFTQKQPEKMNSIDPLLEYFETNLGTFNKKLMCGIMVPLFEALWTTTLKCLDDKLLKGRDADYYISMQRRLASLKSYFLRGGLCEYATYSTKYKEIIDRLQLNSMETEELMLEYYDNASAHENLLTPLDYYGHINIKVAYVEETRGKVTIYVKVENATDLPGLDMSGLSDPYVTFNLCPSTLFPSTQMQKTEIAYKTLNPEFHQTFHIPNVPRDFMDKKGCALHFTVMDHDRLSKDDFAGEVFVSLSSINPMKGFRTVDCMPNIMMPIKRPTTASQTKCFWIALDRATTDRTAKTFITQRNALINNQRIRTDKKFGPEPEPKQSILSKLCEVFQNARRQLNLCNEDVAEEKGPDVKVDGKEAKEKEQDDHESPVPESSETIEESTVCSPGIRRGLKPRSWSADNSFRYHAQPVNRNPFRFPPPSSSLYARRRAASDVTNPFTFKLHTRSLDSGRDAHDNRTVTWSHEDGAWDGYTDGIIPEEQEPSPSEEPRRHSDPCVPRTPPKHFQMRQVSDPGSGSRRLSEASLTRTVIEEER